MKALVLSGGSIKGAWQAGAIRAVLENGFVPQIITGISVGAINGAYLANQAHDEKNWAKIGRDLFHFWEDEIKSPSDLITKKSALTLGFQILRKRFDGMVSVGPMRKLLYDTLDAKKIFNSPVKYFCGYSCLETGKIFYNTPYLNLENILASAAIPIILPVIQLDGTNSIDGGVIDSAPLKKAIDGGATEIICIATMPEKLTVLFDNWGDVLKYGNRLMDIISNNTLNNDIKEAQFINSFCPDGGTSKLDEPCKGKRKIKLTIIRPSKQIKATIGDFDSGDIRAMIADGYAAGKISET